MNFGDATRLGKFNPYPWGVTPNITPYNKIDQPSTSTSKFTEEDPVQEDKSVPEEIPLEGYTTSDRAIPKVDAAEDIGKSILDTGAEESVTTLGDMVPGLGEALMVAQVVKATGDATSNSILTNVSNQYNQEHEANLLVHSSDANVESSLIDAQHSQNLSSLSNTLNIGSWFGPIGSALGYAFSNYNQPTNLNIGYSPQGMIDPSSYLSSASSYASQVSSSNPSLMSQ